MPNDFEVNELDLMVDRMTLTHYRELASNILARMEAIQAKYPEGTFEEGEDDEEEDEEIADAPKARRKPGPKPGSKKAGKKKQGSPPTIGLTDALRGWPLEHKGTVVVAEFKSARPDFKPNSVDGVVAGLVKRGEFRRDPDQAGVIHATRNLQDVAAAG